MTPSTSEDTPQPRFAVQSIQMGTSDFTISYYDRTTKHEHVAKGLTSMIPHTLFSDTLGPAFDKLIAAIRDQPAYIHPLGEPYPTEIVE